SSWAASSLRWISALMNVYGEAFGRTSFALRSLPCAVSFVWIADMTSSDAPWHRLTDVLGFPHAASSDIARTAAAVVTTTASRRVPPVRPTQSSQTKALCTSDATPLPRTGEDATTRGGLAASGHPCSVSRVAWRV